jgi:ferritin-like metal-binding protein YciE
MADEQHSLQTYVSDMLALERHVRVPFETQAKDDDFARYGNAANLVSELLSISQQHIDALDRCLETLGGHAASPGKSAVSQVEGFFAGAVDKMRKTKVSKALRDDYTACALCSAGYTMLATTAMALGDANVANVAQNHLRDYARIIMDVGRDLPEVVVAELAELDLPVDASTVQNAQRAVEQAWRSGAQSQQFETGTIAGTATTRTTSSL